MRPGRPADAGIADEKKPALTVKKAFKEERGGLPFVRQGRLQDPRETPRHGPRHEACGLQEAVRNPAKQSLSARSYSDKRRKMAQDRGLAENLAKARGVRMEKISGKKAPQAPLAAPVRRGKAKK